MIDRRNFLALAGRSQYWNKWEHGHTEGMKKYVVNSTLEACGSRGLTTAAFGSAL